MGETYELTETKPADGYVTAESIVFTVENTAEIQKHRMEDDVTKVSISKTDITGKQEVPGAKLTIIDKDGKEVESWTSTEEPHYIEMLPTGEYTLHEESAPDGYLVAEDVKFTVGDTTEIQNVVMKDEAKPAETEDAPAPISEPPKTGDDTPILFWIVLAGLSACAVAISLLTFRKRKQH